MSLQLKNVTVGQAMEAIDKANALVVRDSRAVIKLAEKLLEAADRGEPEVMYELELIEVTTTPSCSVLRSVLILPSTDGKTISIEQWKKRRSHRPSTTRVIPRNWRLTTTCGRFLKIPLPAPVTPGWLSRPKRWKGENCRRAWFSICTAAATGVRGMEPHTAGGD
jgi:hypothetical protein